MPQFLHPGWLILIPAVIALGWLWRHLGFQRPLRALALLAGILALADPVVGWLSSGMDLWVLVDRSASCESEVTNGEAEWLSLLESGKEKSDDELKVCYFADGISRPNPDEGEGLAGGNSLSRLRTALQSTLSQASNRRATRVLAITDGFSTESLDGVAAKAKAAGIPIDVRLIPPPGGDDVRVAALRSPTRTLEGEPIVLDVEIHGRTSNPITVHILRDGEELGTREVSMNGEKSMRLQFADRVASPGSHLYEARVTTPGDTVPGNDVMNRWVEVAAGSRILLISRFQDDPLARFLSAQGFSVVLRTDPLALHIGDLSGCRAVVINNVGAFDIPRPFLEAMDFFVREQGGGLAMFGGKNSFGSGGYFESPIDELLPVSMELKAEHRKLAVAMAIVMDRSGSMGMTVAGGQTKMQLANEGSGRTVELLGAQDTVAVFAVDSTAHVMVPATQVGPHRDKILARVRRIQSSGGGIYMFQGLSAAVETLEKVDVGQRHIILFSDASDTEEPGAYKKLLKEFTEDGGTLSVIGLGTPSDPDAHLLDDTAKRGNGRIFYTTDALAIPNIFAQETVTVARSTFVDEPVGLQGTGTWIEIAGGALEWLPEVGGYNLCYLRDGATAHAITTDDYSAPLVSTMRRGLGRTAAICFPGGGDHSDQARAWASFGDFSQTLGRWLAGDGTPPGIALRANTVGTDLVIDLHFDPDAWNDVIGGTPPPIAVVTGEGKGRRQKVTWEHLAPGNLRATKALEPGQPARGAIKLGKGVVPFGPLVVGGEIEWDFDPAKPAALTYLAEETGGRELVDLGTAWERPEVQGGRSLRQILGLIFLILIVVDALSSRIGKVFSGKKIGAKAKDHKLAKRDKKQASDAKTPPSSTAKATRAKRRKPTKKKSASKSKSSGSAPSKPKTKTSASPPKPDSEPAAEAKPDVGDLLRKAKSRRKK